MNRKIFALFSLSIVSLLILTSGVLALDTGFLSPTANTNSGWSNPQDVYASDNIRAVADADLDIANYYNFGFNIPSGAIINGIEIKVEGYNEGGSSPRQANVSISWDGGSTYTSGTGIKTTNVPTDSNYPYTDGIIYLGGSNDKWNKSSWLLSEFSNSTFRLKLDANTGSNNQDLLVDQIQVKV